MSEKNFFLDGESKEVVIREGAAPEVFPPRAVKLNGNIFAPLEFVTKRKVEIPANKTNVVFDYDKLSIELTVDEDVHFASIITGKLEKFPDLLSFCINNPKRFSIVELFKVLRLKRAYFQTREEHARILSQLQKLEVNTQVKFTSANDLKGNAAIQKLVEAKSNLDLSFILNIPVYKGIAAKTFVVEIDVEPTDGTILCGLVSSDLADIEIQLRDEIMTAQLKAFSEYVVIEK